MSNWKTTRWKWGLSETTKILDIEFQQVDNHSKGAVALEEERSQFFKDREAFEDLKKVVEADLAEVNLDLDNRPYWQQNYLENEILRGRAKTIAERQRSTRKSGKASGRG